jgi:1-phosphofructokinase
MIVTVTANPSVDLTMAVHGRPNGDVQRARWVLIEPSGKGVNVAVALRRTACDALAVLPLGRGPGADLVPMLDALELNYVGIDVAGHVRTNVTLVEDDGRTSKINEVGGALAPAEATALVDASLAHSCAADWVAWCGSLPAGFDGVRLADAVAAARERGRLVAVDTSQAALPTVLARPPAQLPHLIKPNAEELAELTGRSFRTVGDVADAATELVESGVETVLVSLGADGAILADRGTAWHGTAAAARVANTAGAGDAFLAGYLRAAQAGSDRAGSRERLASALRFGAAAVAQAGTLFAPPQKDAIADVTPVDRERVLSSPVAQPSATAQEEPA